ncbi:hypothetical protein [Pollutibacter soli]|uniref:hypothetical protein n=1 Tax=Pollutibacter soli TaxID=3034157 RepID=UPI003013F47A
MTIVSVRKKNTRVAILLNKELFHFSGNTSKYNKYGTVIKTTVPKSKSKPVKKILKKLIRLKSTADPEMLNRIIRTTIDIAQKNNTK